MGALAWVSVITLSLAVASAARSIDLHQRDCRIHVWEKVAYALFAVSALFTQLAR